MNNSHLCRFVVRTYPAVHQHISRLYHYLLFADQSEVNYVLLPEVLHFAARLDHILT